MATTVLSGGPIFDPANRIDDTAPVLDQRYGVPQRTEQVDNTRPSRQPGYHAIHTATALFSAGSPLVQRRHAHPAPDLHCPIAP